MFLEMLLLRHYENPEEVFNGERILKLKPEVWAHHLGGAAAAHATQMLAQGVALEELLEWQHKQGELSMEFLTEIVEELEPEMKPRPATRP